MYRNSWKGMSLAALFVFAAACSDDPAGPEGLTTNLSTDEAADVAETVSDAIDGILDGEIAARPSVAPIGSGSQIAFSMAPEVEEFEWERSRECREGGMVSASGTGTKTADRELHTLTIEFSGEKVIADCQRVRGDVIITFNGGGSIEGYRHKENGEFVGIQWNEQEGRFEWVTSDGRSGECAYDLRVEWDPATHTKTVTGTVCDKEIDKSYTRDGSAGNDRASDA